jgi:dipeptidyl aminopeptidase/acylaminoacyl peptidase
VCLGVADDHAVRFSPDGRWLAFASFDGEVPADGTLLVGSGQNDPPMFLRIVGPSGQTHPAAEDLRRGDIEGLGARVAAPALQRAGFRWLDWASTKAAIAAQRADGSLWIYDLNTGKRRALGSGRSPTFDPGGDHLLVMSAESDKADAAGEASVIHLESAGDRENLGLVRDARWLPPNACGSRSEGNYRGR